jgi:hypothetical protein
MLERSGLQAVSEPLSGNDFFVSLKEEAAICGWWCVESEKVVVGMWKVLG